MDASNADHHGLRFYLFGVLRAALVSTAGELHKSRISCLEYVYKENRNGLFEWLCLWRIKLWRGTADNYKSLYPRAAQTAKCLLFYLCSISSNLGTRTAKGAWIDKYQPCYGLEILLKEESRILYKTATSTSWWCCLNRRGHEFKQANIDDGDRLSLFWLG